MNRRNFIKIGAVAGTGILVPNSVFTMAKQNKRLFRISLNPGAIGVKITQEEMVDMAVQYGFEAILPVADSLAKMSPGQLDTFLDRKKAADLTWDAAGLPVDFRRDDTTFKEGLQKLPAISKTLQNAGVDKMSTWMMPTHADLTYLQNFKQHAYRLREIAKILEDYNIKLGLEYVGTKTLLIRARHPFISGMYETLELIEETGSNNIGLQLDSFHWFCAEEETADIEKLSNRQIITCDLNDATAGRTSAEQIDGERELPGDSGVIDLTGFLNALIKIGYDGPIRAEPFNAKLNSMETHDALAATAKAMKSTIDKAG